MLEAPRVKYVKVILEIEKETVFRYFRGGLDKMIVNGLSKDHRL